MRILAIESSTRNSAAGLFNCTCDLSVDDNKFLSSLFLSAETDTNFETIGIFSSGITPVRNSSSTLAPGIQRLFQDSGIDPNDFDLLTVTTGPGSFTSLRLGVVTAKTLAFATGCKITGVNVADAIACQSLRYLAENDLRSLSVGIDIGRREVLVFDYQIESANCSLVCEPEIKSPAQWYGTIDFGSTLVAGTGTKFLRSMNLESVKLAPNELQHPTIGTTAKLGLLNFKQHGGEDFWNLQPYYSRPSAAEEKIAE